MASAPPAGILHPSATLRPPPLSFFIPAAAVHPPAISFRQPTRYAHRRAVVLSRPASPMLRCSSSSSSQSACVDNQDEEYVVVPPPWMMSDEEAKEFLALDLSPAAIRERFRLESVEARAAVLGAVADVLRPLRDNLNDVRNLKYVHETEEFQIGMPFGALMACIGMYQLWNFAPNLCLDVAMPYAFYKLSVLAADVRRRGFSPDLIIRIKLALLLAMILKDLHLKCTPLDYYFRLPVFFIYFLSVSWDLIGKKKFAKYALPACIYSIVTLFQQPKLMKKPKKSSGSSKEGDGKLVQSVHEPENSGDVKEGGQTLQFISEPNDSSSAMQDGEVLQSVSAPDSHIHITVKQEGEPMQVFVSEPENLY